MLLVACWQQINRRSRNAKSQLEPVVECYGQPRGAQVHTMYLSDWKGWSQDAPLPRPHLRVGSAGKGDLSEDSCVFEVFLEVSRFLPPLFLCLWLLCLGVSSLAVA